MTNRLLVVDDDEVLRMLIAVIMTIYLLTLRTKERGIPKTGLNHLFQKFYAIKA